MTYFWIRGYLKRPLKKRLLGLLAIGGCQGLIGWWMVKSGLLAKPSYHKEPRVSVYRLFVHLNTAMIIFSLLLWNGLTLVRTAPEFTWKFANPMDMLRMKKVSTASLHLIALAIAAGSIVAGLDAGKVFNTWPLMNGG